MKAYFLLGLGAIWIIVAILFRFVGLGFIIAWPKRTINPATINTFFRLTLPLIVFGWIVPTALGLWLLWVKR